MITIDDLKKVEIRAGRIVSVEAIEGSDKLLKLSVDFGEENLRTILSGIAKWFPLGEKRDGLVGQTLAFAANLEPRAMMGMESQGMLLAVSGDEFFSPLNFSNDVPPGVLVK